MDGSATLEIAALRAERVRLGLSQADVAARIGTTQSAVARLESYYPPHLLPRKTEFLLRELLG